MSDVPQHISVSRVLAGRWQIPLLVAAACLLAGGLWRLRPVSKPPSFDVLYARAAALKDARLYVDASRGVESLLGDPALNLAPEQRGRLHALMAEVIYLHELGNAVHGRSNAQAILDHLEAAGSAGVAMSAAVELMRARAWEWLSHAAEAVEAYRRSLAGGVGDPWSIRRRIVQIQEEANQISPAALREELGAFLAADDVGDEVRFWALERQVVLLAEEGAYEEADRLLSDQAERFSGPQWKNQHVFLRALMSYHLGRSEEAEPALRSLLGGVVPADGLYARAGWLLGRIYLSHEAPQPALSFFDDVLSKTVPGPYYGQALLGRAEALAELERHEESVEAFERLIREVLERPYDWQVDLQVVRQTTTALSERLRTAGRPAEAMAYLRIGARLAPPGDVGLAAIYAERQGDLALALGRFWAERALRSGRASEGDSARSSFVEAAESYLRLAKLRMTDEPASASATWKAADALDLAGERGRRAEVLAAFVRERPDNPRVPEALLRLGQTYQVLGEGDRAIAAYQRNLTEYPRTYWAVQCLVPLAACFVEADEAVKAEETLLRIVDRQPGEPVALIRPEAREYQDALFALGDLYIRTGQYERAIGRFEEALSRYPEDGRADRAAFLVADAYRRSAAQIREDLKDPQKVAFKDDLKYRHQERLKRAEALFSEVIERYRNRPADSLGELDAAYLKLSHLYRADAIYERSAVSDPSDVEPYVQALGRYEEAAWLYQHDPVAMSAYVQMVNCHLRMGNIAEARRVLQRAGWALRHIPEDRFDGTLPGRDRAFWEDYLSWLEKAPMFAAG